VINRYAVRAAINPVVSVMAMEVPKIISSSILIGVVMSIPRLADVQKCFTEPGYVRAGTLLLLTSVMLLVPI